MKLTRLFFLFSSLCIVLSACESDDENNGGGNVPEGALPSAVFKPNNLPDEPYAEDAIKIVAESEDAPFYSIELMADGHYLLSLSRSNDLTTKVVSEGKTDNGAINIHKNRKTSATRTRTVIDEDGTISFGYGDMYYGPFVKIGDNKYRMSNGGEIDFSKFTTSKKPLTYKSPDGTMVEVDVYIVESTLDESTQSLCRTWDCNSFEVWGYVNNAYVAHGKQTIVNGEVNSYFQSSPMYDIEDFFDDDSETCYKVVFSLNGTYICFYKDDTAEVYSWQWSDPLFHI